MGAGGAPAPTPRLQPGGFPWGQETHGPYTAFMQSGVEGIVMPKAQPIPNPNPPNWNVNDPTAVPAQTGPGFEGWYKSEFGCVSWSSFESMTAEMPEDQWSMSSPGALNRNWNASNIIAVFFGPEASVEMGRYGEAAFKKQLYQSMVGQALFLKTEIEAWRSQNVFGTTIWMYNEIWPTGGWGSIEYGADMPGQVVGGRWKPLHYTFRKSTFADQLSTCNTAGACFITNDAPFPFAGTITVRLINMLTGNSTVMKRAAVSLPAGAGVTQWYCADGASVSWVGTMDAIAPAPPPPPPPPPPSYGVYYHQYPDPATAKFVQLNSTNETACEKACTADAACLGFTMEDNSGTDPVADCWSVDQFVMIGPECALRNTAGVLLDLFSRLTNRVGCSTPHQCLRLRNY